MGLCSRLWRRPPKFQDNNWTKLWIYQSLFYFLFLDSTFISSLFHPLSRTVNKKTKQILLLSFFNFLFPLNWHPASRWSEVAMNHQARDLRWRWRRRPRKYLLPSFLISFHHHYYIITENWAHNRRTCSLVNATKQVQKRGKVVTSLKAAVAVAMAAMAAVEWMNGNAFVENTLQSSRLVSRLFFFCLSRFFAAALLFASRPNEREKWMNEWTRQQWMKSSHRRSFKFLTLSSHFTWKSNRNSCCYRFDVFEVAHGPCHLMFLSYLLWIPTNTLRSIQLKWHCLP